MNFALLIGRLTTDPEIRWSGENAVVGFSVAVDRMPKKDGTHETDFPRIVVFGRMAENCDRYLVKGSLVAVQGRIQTGSYMDKNNVKRFTTEIVAARVKFLDSKNRTEEYTSASNAQDDEEYSKKEEKMMSQGWEDLDDDMPY